MINEKDLWSEKISFIKTLKEFFSGIKYDEVNLWPIMANDTYTYYKHQEQRSKLNRFLTIIKCLFLREKIKLGNTGKNKVFATYFMLRKDHQEMVRRALEKFSSEELFLFDGYEYKQKKNLFKYSFRIPNIFLLMYISKKFRKAKLKEILNENYGLFIVKTFLRFRQIDYFKKIIERLNPRAYVAFCSSAFPEEAIFTLLSKQRGIPTFTLQHGFYSPPKKEFSPIAIQNENVISDYMFVWGENSKKNIKDYVEEKAKIIIAGNPKYKIIPSELKPFNLEKITFFLSVPPNEESNKKIVRILNEFAKKNPNIRIKLKLHPFDDPKNYMDLVTEKNVIFEEKTVTVQGLLQESDLIVTHYTTIALEALFYNKPIFRFDDASSLHFWNNSQDEFSNLKEFEAKIKKLHDFKELKKLIKFYQEELLKNFYFEKNKEPSQVYYEKIMEKAK
jgi:hypothetical protein